jgi:hypothetical protein
MRHEPASSLRGKSTSPTNPVPKEGTQIREVYDLFQANKGVPIDFKTKRNTRVVADLVDFYGLDIRRIRNGVWVLAGEWFGKVYVDYIAQNIEKGTR